MDFTESDWLDLVEYERGFDDYGDDDTDYDDCE